MESADGDDEAPCWMMAERGTKAAGAKAEAEARKRADAAKENFMAAE